MSNEEPLKKEDAEKALKGFLGPGQGVVPQRHDKTKLIIEWVTSDPTKYANVKQWARDKHPEIHPQTFQNWGTRRFWNDLRSAFQTKGLIRAIERAPELISERYEKLLRVKDKALDNLEKIMDLLAEDLAKSFPTGDQKKDREETRETIRFNSTMQERLAQTQNILTDILKKLDGTHAAGGPSVHIDLHAMTIKSLQERDKKFNVNPGTTEAG